MEPGKTAFTCGSWVSSNGSPEMSLPLGAPPVVFWAQQIKP
jgi:hypothetical protein